MGERGWDEGGALRIIVSEQSMFRDEDRTSGLLMHVAHGICQRRRIDLAAHAVEGNAMRRRHATLLVVLRPLVVLHADEVISLHGFEPRAIDLRPLFIAPAVLPQ